MNVVEIDNLWVRYGKVEAVRGIQLHIPQGEVFGFIGPNGAGKSSTIKVLATLMRKFDGRALVNGLDVAREPFQVREQIGYMPDFFGVYDDLTVKEYLFFFAAAYRLPMIKRGGIVDDVLELTDLTHKLNSPVDGLSRGMKQRLALARVLLHDPELLLLDEPASGLDPRARIEIRELLKALAGMGKTILISSHISARAGTTLFSNRNYRSGENGCTRLAARHLSAATSNSHHPHPIVQQRQWHGAKNQRLAGRAERRGANRPYLGSPGRGGGFDRRLPRSAARPGRPGPHVSARGDGHGNGLHETDRGNHLMKLSLPRWGLPLLAKELVEQAARPRTYVVRVVYAVLLFFAGFMFYYSIVSRYNASPYAVLGHGRELFQAIINLQFVGIYLFAPAMTCGVLTFEKERNTLGLLFLTRLGPWTIVLEKYLGRIIPMCSFLILSLPLLVIAYSLGGFTQQYVWTGVWLLLITVFQVSALALLVFGVFSHDGRIIHCQLRAGCGDVVFAADLQRGLSSAARFDSSLTGLESRFDVVDTFRVLHSRSLRSRRYDVAGTSRDCQFSGSFVDRAAAAVVTVFPRATRVSFRQSISYFASSRRSMRSSLG